MGVPAFFRWLSKKYPSIVVEAPKNGDHGYSFDNLYLDMNGIIHPCTHPEHKAPPETEEDMFEAIFEYIDMLMLMVQPKRMLYMAVDGVAPRAKMNQQRSRRFRAIKESQDKKDEVAKIKEQLHASGIEFDERDNKAHFDSNVITPGTQFMINLSNALRTWIDRKLDPKQDVEEKRDEYGNLLTAYNWPKDLVVILSDASVPGEGEHKIIDYIRRQKVQKDYDPNLSHCLCGADADLIMLGLATHELNFTILREEFVPNQPKPCDICGQIGHEMPDCKGKANIPDPNFLIHNTGPGFIYIRLNVLREYFAKECDDLNLERYIDDFVFLCFFVGNDFLPHLPSLEIRENAIGRLLNIYKGMMSKYSHPKPYLTENGFVALNKIQTIFCELGKMEDDIFRRRRTRDLDWRQKLKRQKQEDHKTLQSAWMTPQPIMQRGAKVQQLGNVKQEASNLRAETNSKTRMNAMLEPDESPVSMPASTEDSATETSSIEDEDENDNVQLWHDGFKERYYLHKFDCGNHEDVSPIVAREYMIGLCWVLRYYYQGCVDWQWFYPFHYAPFASDFEKVDLQIVNFKRDAKPFKPLEQLMSVFPAGSCQNLPPTWQKLMKDPKSPIIDFYPTNFKIDLNGKKAAWMGVALLPFIDERRLFSALEKVYGDLTGPEVERNSLGSHLVFLSKSYPQFYKALADKLKVDGPIESDHKSLNGMFGILRRSPRYTDKIQNAICLEYYDPKYDLEFVFPAKRLPKAKSPPTVLKPGDFDSNNRNGNNYRPTIGFAPRQDRATVSQFGHRVIKAQVNNPYQSSGSSATSGPTSSLNPFATPFQPRRSYAQQPQQMPQQPYTAYPSYQSTNAAYQQPTSYHHQLQHYQPQKQQHGYNPYAGNAYASNYSSYVAQPSSAHHQHAASYTPYQQQPGRSADAYHGAQPSGQSQHQHHGRYQPYNAHPSRSSSNQQYYSRRH